MSVKNETIKSEEKELVDDISNVEFKNVENEESLNQDLMASLKAKMAAKKNEDNIRIEEQKKEEVMPPRIIEKKKRSIEFGVVGSGQAGSRLSQSMYELGYPAIAFNTTAVDLEYIKIPEENKLIFDYGIGGSAKNLNIGHDAAEANIDAINALVSDKLNNAQVLLLCLSLAGGSGSGSAETLVDVLSSTGKPVVVITILPMSTEDSQAKSNSLTTLSKLSKLVQNKKIANLIVVDNAKLEAIYADVSQMDFFEVSNHAIVSTIDVFNRYSSMPSKTKPMDQMEWAKILTDGEGLTIYGEMSVDQVEDPIAIAEAVIQNLNSGLLAGGFDLKQTRYAGVLFVGNSKIMNSLPSSSINYAMEIIKENCPSATNIFRGVYEDNTIKENVLKVYSIYSGLGLPTSRIDQLKKEAHEESAKVRGREQTRNLSLNLDTGTEESVSAADRVREAIKNKSSGFNKNFVGIKDFRKK